MRQGVRAYRPGKRRLRNTRSHARVVHANEECSSDITIVATRTLSLGRVVHPIPCTSELVKLPWGSPNTTTQHVLSRPNIRTMPRLVTTSTAFKSPHSLGLSHRLSIAISTETPGPNEAATTWSWLWTIVRRVSSTINTVGLELLPRVRHIS